MHPDMGPDMDRLSPTIPSTGTVLVESTDSAKGVEGMESDLPRQSVSGEGVRTPAVEPTVWHVRRGEMLRRVTHPFPRGWSKSLMWRTHLYYNLPST